MDEHITATIGDPFTGPSFKTEQKLSDGRLKPLADLIGLPRLGHRQGSERFFVQCHRRRKVT
jgi:hypothetical protein